MQKEKVRVHQRLREFEVRELEEQNKELRVQVGLNLS